LHHYKPHQNSTNQTNHIHHITTSYCGHLGVSSASEAVAEAGGEGHDVLERAQHLDGRDLARNNSAAKRLTKASVSKEQRRKKNTQILEQIKTCCFFQHKTQPCADGKWPSTGLLRAARARRSSPHKTGLEYRKDSVNKRT
jgi:hypothetical protein